MSNDSKLTHAQAEQVFEELLRNGRTHLQDIRRRACRERKTPLTILVEHGDPREDE